MLSSLKPPGGFALAAEDGRALRLPTRKTAALLAYLALAAPRAPAREQLAGLLWGNAGEAAALASLRQALSLIVKACGREVVVAGGRTVALAAHAIRVDALEFEAALATGDAAALERAVALYGGDLLAGLELNEAGFDEWLLARRRRLQEQAIAACAALAGTRLAAGDAEGAERAAQRLLELDPLEEQGHRALMSAHAARGRRSAMRRQYEVCVQLLRRELATEPTAATRRLYHELLSAAPPAGERAGVASAAPGGAPVAEAAPVHDAPLVGREAELTRLLQALSHARAGRSSLVLLLGEAGLGKTRLTQELAARATAGGFAVHTGRCHASQQGVPFSPWAELLRSVGAVPDSPIVSGIAPHWRHELVSLLPEWASHERRAASAGPVPLEPGEAAQEEARSGSEGEGTATGRQARLFEAVAQVAEACCARAPALWVVEDLHWCDEVSLRLLAFIARRLERRPMLLLASARVEDVAAVPALARVLREWTREAPDAASRIVLEPLTREQTAALVGALLGAGRRHAGTAAAALTEQLWATSEGNPFVIVEAVRALSASGTSGPTEAAARAGLDLTVPDRVRELILGHVESVGTDARRLLAAVAVAGRETGYGVLKRASGLDDRAAADAVEELVRRRLLGVVGESFDLLHARVRHVLAESLLPPVRTALHLALAEALESMQAAGTAPLDDLLAYHYGRTDQHAKAAHYLARLAGRAAHGGAHEQALDLLAQARAHVGRLARPDAAAQERELLLGQARSLFFLGRFAEVLELLLPEQAAFDGAGDALAAATYYLRRGSTRTYLGHHAEAIADARRALAEAGACGDRATMGKAHFLLSLEHFWAQPEQGVVHGEQAVGLLAVTPERWWTGQACWILGLNLAYRGRFAAGLAMEARAAQGAEETGDRRLASYAAWTSGFIHTLAGEHEAALSACRRSVQLALDPLNRMTSLGILALALVERGEPAEALELLAEAIPQAQRFRTPQMEGLFLGFRGDAERLLGRLEAAQVSAAQGEAIARDSGYAYGQGWVLRVLARIARARGDAPDAVRQMQAAIAVFDGMGAPFEGARCRVEQAQWLASAGDAGAALSSARHGLGTLRELGLAAQADLAQALCSALALADY